MGLAQIVEHKESEQVRVRLAELGTGLTVELLHDVMADSEVARASATPLDPLNAGGLLAYIARTRGLRSRLLPFQWTKEDPSGCPVTVSPDGRRQIMVATGDEATGSDAIPSTQYRKGIVMQRAVTTNVQGCLWPEFDNQEPRQQPTRETWILLVRRDERADGAIEVRAELSLPSRMEKNFPTEWQERIVLPVLVLNTGESKLKSTGTFDEAEDIDIPITRD